MSNKTLVGEKIRAFRLMLNMDQVQFGIYIGGEENPIKQPMISRWEDGQIPEDENKRRLVTKAQEQNFPLSFADFFDQ